jgi:ribonuclease HI
MVKPRLELLCLWIFQYINGSGVGILLISIEEQVIKYKARFEFLATKNVSKYKAFLAGLCLAKALNAYHLKVHSDSKLVVGQFQGIYESKGPTIQLYL